MLNDITVGQYLPGKSAVHRIDPRVKILLVVFYIVAIFVTDVFWMYGVFAAYVLGAALIAKVPLRVLLRSIKPLLFIVVFTFIMNLLLVREGELLLQVWKIRIYSDGIIYAVRLALRLILLVFGTSMLTLTTSPLSLTDALERLLKPLSIIRFPAHELAMMMTIALRFIPTLLEEADKIMKAQKARGADFETGNIFQKAKALVPLLVPLFVNAFRRADELAMAMESRCYHGGKGRTRMRILTLSWVDAAAVAVNLGLLALLIIFG
ncbi:MAG: energy-coupling factor transporter transmembrane protein EcfT [Clostridia bacterium]|nr:energy-coupling factor transporter transmembrane protein EcfT [Clostridia bacterium]